MMARNSYLIGKAFNKYLWASVMTVAATQVSGIVDATLVGNFVSAEGLAAVNINKPLIQTLYSITILYLSGGTMLTGMAIGNGDRERANRMFTGDLVMSLLVGVVSMVLGLCFFDRISDMLCTSDRIRPLYDDFSFVTILSFIPMALMCVFQQYVTIDGSPKTVTRSVVVGNLVNLTLDVVFMKYLGWGMAGAAWATLISYVVCVLMVIPHFLKPNTLRLARFCIERKHISKVLGIGIPLFLSTALMSVQYWGTNLTASRYLGDNGLMLLAVCMQLFSFSMIILTGTLRTIQPVGAILKGINDTVGIQMLMKKAYMFMTICLVVYTVAIILLPEQISRLLGMTDPAAMSMAKTALPMFSLNIVMQALLYNLLPAYQFYGRKNLALFLSIGQTLLPMVFFWLTDGNWMGFFYGQIIVAIGLLIISETLRRRHDDAATGHTLTPLTLVPRQSASSVFETSVATNIVSLSEATDALRRFLSNNGVADRTKNTATLCTEEFIKNIIQHGNANYVDIKATVNEDGVAVSLHDDGIAFNPVDMLNAPEEKIGLGLLIARNIIKDVQYKYIFNQNIVTIKSPTPALSKRGGRYV